MLIFLWQTGSAPPPPPVDQSDTHDGVDHAAERQRTFREEKSALRATVERAYRLAVYGPDPDQPLTAVPSLATLAQLIMPDLRSADISASLTEIEALLNELEGQRAHYARRAADEEALLVLLLS